MTVFFCAGIRVERSQKWQAAGAPVVMHARAAARAFAVAPQPLAALAAMALVAIPQAQEVSQAPDKALLAAVAAALAAAAATQCVLILCLPHLFALMLRCLLLGPAQCQLVALEHRFDEKLAS